MTEQPFRERWNTAAPELSAHQNDLCCKNGQAYFSLDVSVRLWSADEQCTPLHKAFLVNGSFKITACTADAEGVFWLGKRRTNSYPHEPNYVSVAQPCWMQFVVLLKS